MDEYDEVFNNKEEPKKETKKDIEVEFDDINGITNERNKIHHEMNIKVPEYKDRIGRLNLSLFGDPDNPDWESKLDLLKEELEHPMTRTHPIADKTKAVVREIKDLQIEYDALHKFYMKAVKEIGTLLDNSIKLYTQDFKDKNKLIEELKYKMDSLETGVEISESLKKADEKITEVMVNDFVKNYEGQKYLDKYYEGIKANDKMVIMTSKSLFVRKAKDFFINKHPDPKRVANMLFNKLTKELPKLTEAKIEKNKISENHEEKNELITTKSSSLKENQNHNNVGLEGESEDNNEEKPQ